MAVMCHLLVLLTSPFLGKSVRFPSLSQCGCVGRTELGVRAEPGQNARAGKRSGLFHYMVAPLYLCSGQLLLLQFSQGWGFLMQPSLHHGTTYVGDGQADLQLWYLAWQGHDPHPTQPVSHSVCGSVCGLVASCPCGCPAPEPSH